MCTAYVVDDEIIAREGIIKLTEMCGVQVIGEADDGESALLDIMNLNPDIVISDVKMYRMNGIEMATKLRERGYRGKILFVSAYEEVEFLKAALKINANDYILKPVNSKEYKEVIKKVVKTLEHEKEVQRQAALVDKNLIRIMPFLTGELVLSLIEGAYESTESVEKT